MKKIIVPVDFSECAVNAVRYASSLAKLTQAQLLVIYVHKTEVVISATPAWLPYAEILPVPEIVHKQMAKIKDMVEKKEITVQTYIMEGELKETITELAQQKHADLVVMGTEGINFAYDSVWGTHTTDLISEKKIPVLVIPQNYKGTLEANAEFVFATDFKGLDFIPDFFIELTKSLKATLNVFYDTEPYRDIDSIQQETEEMGYIRKVFSGSNVTINHSYKENLIHAVESFASQKHASLIVMIAHKRGFLGNLFHQSVTKQMALHTHVPFLAIPDEPDEMNTSISNSGFVG